MSYHLKTVNFGAGNAGLATVGYALYNPDSTTYAARSTSGVYEVGTSTGIYMANINFPDGADVVLLWDTGGSSPYYASDEGANQLNNIQEGTDKIRVIWNTLMNQNDVYLKMMKKLDSFKMPASATKEYTKEFKELSDLVKKIKLDGFPTLSDIKDALNVVVNPAPVNIPETKIPDYSQRFDALLSAMGKVMVELNKIPKQHKDYTVDLLKIAVKIESLVNSLQDKVAVPSAISNAVDNIILSIKDTKKELDASIATNTKLEKYVKDILMLREAAQFIDQPKGNKEMDLVRMQLGL